MLSSKQRLEILAVLPDPVFVLSRTGRYLTVTGGTDARYYHDGSSLIGKYIADILAEDKANWFIGEIGKALGMGGLHIVEYPLAGSDVKGLTQEGPDSPIWFEGRIQALDFQVDGEDAVLWVASNISARHDMEEQLRKLSQTDSLTGLSNRRRFSELATEELARALRYEHPISILIFDIDHFKRINDNFGHHAGDLVLIELAKIVLDCTRESDSVARWGGEEFTVLMPFTGLVAAVSVGEKIRKEIALHPFPNGLEVTVSIGIAEWQLHDESVDSVVSRADDALYLAKDAGRNRIVPAPPPGPDSYSTRRDKPAFHSQWRKQYESGDKDIDLQHMIIFNMAQKSLYLARDPQLSKSGSEVHKESIKLIDEMIAQTQAHCAFEESILSGLDWRSLESHSADHRRLIARATTLRQALGEAGTPDQIQELVNFLAIDVIVNHMLQSDREFFPLIKETQRSVTPNSAT